MGFDALRGVSGQSHSNNTAIGFEAGLDITTGSNNLFAGYRAGENVTTGNTNVALGQQALRNNQTGSGNISIGQDSLSNASNTAAAFNVAIGQAAGSALTTGGENIIIGFGANASSATVSNEITLGNTSINRFRVPGAGIDNTSAALSGTTPSADVGARDTYTLTTSGNTTFTFTGAPSSGQVGTFSLIITAGGAHTITWPTSVDWAGGTAPDAPASGAKNIYTFTTIDAGTTWYGFLAAAAVA
jgi:hypothetical protein